MTSFFPKKATESWLKRSQGPNSLGDPSGPELQIPSQGEGLSCMPVVRHGRTLTGHAQFRMIACYQRHPVCEIQWESCRHHVRAHYERGVTHIKMETVALATHKSSVVTVCYLPTGSRACRLRVRAWRMLR